MGFAALNPSYALLDYALLDVLDPDAAALPQALARTFDAAQKTWVSHRRRDPDLHGDPVAPSHSRPRLRKVRSNHRSGRPSRGSGSGRNAAEPNRLATGSNNLGRDASPNRTLPTLARHRVLDPWRPVQSALPAEQHER